MNNPLFKPSINQQKKDFQTPPDLARWMVGLLGGNDFYILEPTPGDGNIVSAIKQSGRDVTAPDDFFKLEKRKFDAVVMNPPFSEATAFGLPAHMKGKGMQVGYHFLYDCLQLADTIITVMPSYTLLDSDKRFRDLLSFGLVSVTYLPRKTFGYIRVQTAVFHLKKGWRDETTLGYYGYEPDMQGRLL